MRRGASTAALLALALSVALGPRANAHPGAITPTAPVGEETTVSFGSTADEGDLAGLTVILPDGFALDRVVIGGGWRAVVEGSTVLMGGPPIAFGGAIRYSFVGEFARRGTYYFRLVERASDGRERTYGGELGSIDPAPVVFAGVPVPGAATGDEGGDDGTSPALLAGIAFLVAGVLGAVVLLLRRRAAG